MRMGYNTAALWTLLVNEWGYRAFGIGTSPETCWEIKKLDGIEQQNVIFHRSDILPSIPAHWNAKSVLRWSLGGNVRA
jgi:hypothetical protein